MDHLPKLETLSLGSASLTGVLLPENMKVITTKTLFKAMKSIFGPKLVSCNWMAFALRFPESVSIIRIGTTFEFQNPDEATDESSDKQEVSVGSFGMPYYPVSTGLAPAFAPPSNGITVQFINTLSYPVNASGFGFGQLYQLQNLSALKPLPPRLTVLNVEIRDVVSTYDWSMLPPTLTEIKIMSAGYNLNNYSWIHLPRSLRHLSLLDPSFSTLAMRQPNKDPITSVTEFYALPEGLETLEVPMIPLYENAIDYLPKTLRTLQVYAFADFVPETILAKRTGLVNITEIYPSARSESGWRQPGDPANFPFVAAPRNGRNNANRGGRGGGRGRGGRGGFSFGGTK
jgi:uncharacterized membrane protein YgcG